MNSLTSLFKRENMGQLLLSILFIIYIVMGYKMPHNVAAMIDTIPGKSLVVIIALILFATTNPILGVLGLYVAYDLIRKSGEKTGYTALSVYAPSEEKKDSHFTSFNQFPYTLEQEIVKKMTPMHNGSMLETKATFKPVLDDIHNASTL
jgi:hypothetical protein